MAMVDFGPLFRGYASTNGEKYKCGGNLSILLITASCSLWKFGSCVSQFREIRLFSQNLSDFVITMSHFRDFRVSRDFNLTIFHFFEKIYFQYFKVGKFLYIFIYVFYFFKAFKSVFHLTNLYNDQTITMS